MPKILVLSLGFRGHVNPLLGIVASLAARGHEVTYRCTAEYADEVAATGAVASPYSSMFEGDFEFPKDAAFSYFLATVLEARKVLPQVLPAARELRPDLVLYDGACLSGRLLGEILGCRVAKLCPSYASTEDHSPFAAGRRSFFENSEKVAAFDAEVELLNAEFGTAYDLRASVGHAEGLNIVCMPRAFHPDESVFDARFLFVGPSLLDPPAPDAGGGARPLLYISLGTLNNKKPDFYRKCFETFGGSEWDVVMPVGGRVDASGWEVPANFDVRPSVPQLEVLGRARCFVTQGGMNSTQEGLYYGVPLVVLPSTPEQALTAGRVRELGLGAGLEEESPPAEELARIVREVAGDAGIRARVREFSGLSRGAGGPARAADAIEAYLG